MSSSIEFFFNPRSIAIVGASPTPGKLSNVILESLKAMGFPGAIYPVNPRYPCIGGLKCYSSINEIDEIDVAVIAVPAPLVLEVLKGAAGRVKGAIIVSAGFKEMGDEGRALEEGIRGVVETQGIRVMGPNCFGIYDTISRVDTFFVPGERVKRAGKGGISILSQSGSFAATIMDELVSEGIGVARIVSYGNRVDVGEVDCLDFLTGDEATKAVFLYIESIDEGRRFVEVASRCTRKKPVIAVKVGKRGAGVYAAKSHTGAITGRYEVYRAAFKKAGIIEVDGYEGWKDAYRVLNTYRPVKGKRVLVITDGGGMGVNIADDCEASGLDVGGLKEDTKGRLRERLPGFCSVGNPIDLTGSVNDEDYITALEEGLKDGYDMAIVTVLWGPTTLTERLIGELEKVKRRYNIPVLICSPGGDFTRGMKRVFEENGLPVFSTPEAVVRAAMVLSRGPEGIAIVEGQG